MEQNFYDMSDHELLQAKLSIKREIDRHKKRMEELNGYLNERYFGIARDDLQRQGKDFGTTTVFSDQEDKVKVSIAKKVRKRPLSSAPAMPITLFFENPDTL